LEGKAENEAERDEFLHLAKRSSLYLVEKRNALSSIELLIPKEVEFDSRRKDYFVESFRELCVDTEFDSSTREGFVRLFRELCVGNETLPGNISAVLEEIASSPEQERLLQETHDLALSLRYKNRALLIMVLPYAPDLGWHFSTLRTKITDLQLLKLTLEEMGLKVRTNTYIRGGDGERVKADVVAVLEGYWDMGWKRQKDGTVDLITNLAGVVQTYAEQT
jgi:hypothetical protein